MKITVLGAAGGEVTGSAYCVETDRAKLLVDCGLFQGGHSLDALNRAPLTGAASRLDAVLLTHAHLDHTGRLPLLAREGFRGPVFATPATAEMTGLILHDAARIQAQDADHHNRKRLRPGEKPVEPLYTAAEAERIIGQMRSVAYHDPVDVAPGVRARFFEAGHMLGSSCIQLLVDEGAASRTVVFSGDLGPKGAPILRDFEPVAQADAVFVESTYGDRDHRPFADTVHEFIEIVQHAVAQRGKILVPTFAIGRAQMLVTLLGWIFRHKQVEPFPVFLDSPMAIEASRIYLKHPELYDDETVAFLKEKPLAEDLATLKISVSPEDSKRINDCPGPCLVLAGAGMCNAGRILHHLRNNVGRPGTHVVIVGHQGDGTLGRRLVDGAREIVIFGETLPVRAQVHTLGGFSAHAGQTDLINWFDALAPARPRVFVTHGETAQRTALAGLISTRYGLTPSLPSLNETIVL